jgi:hypothetical protein
MQKTLPLLCAVALLTATLTSSHAQTCVRDSSVLLVDTVFISPRPYTANYPVYGLAAACINQPYTQSVTIKIPATYTFMGIPIAITNANIATTNAITGLPAGITYLCDPPNCVFNANTLGCILLYGTPNNPAQAPDTLDLKIKANIVGTVFGSPANIPIDFPGPIAPGNYYLRLFAAGNCITAAYDLGSPITSVKNSPNPFGQQTVIEVESSVAGGFHFEVLNVLGQRVHSQMVELSTGSNQFTFDAGHLPNGTYYYSLSNPAGKVSKMLTVSR